jgi:hypothetical protein
MTSILQASSCLPERREGICETAASRCLDVKMTVTVGERFSLGKVSLSRCRIGYLTMHDTDLRAGKNVSLLSLERQTRFIETALMK